MPTAIPSSGSSNVAASQITDAGAKGIELLQSADNSEAHTALGLGDAAVRSTGTGGTQVVLGNDSRLSNPRTPTSHTHAASEVGARGEVGLTGAHTIDSGEGGPWYTVGSWRYVASEWPGCAFALRCEGLVTTDGLTGEVRLVRADNGAIAGSTIELDTVPPAHGSASLTLVDGADYLLQQRFNVVPPGESFTLLGARLCIWRS